MRFYHISHLVKTHLWQKQSCKYHRDDHFPGQVPVGYSCAFKAYYCIILCEGSTFKNPTTINFILVIIISKINYAVDDDTSTLIQKINPFRSEILIVERSGDQPPVMLWIWEQEWNNSVKEEKHMPKQFFEAFKFLTVVPMQINAGTCKHGNKAETENTPSFLHHPTHNTYWIRSVMGNLPANLGIVMLQQVEE